MTRQILKGSTNVSVEIYIIDSTDGTPELSVVFNTSGIDLNYRRDLAAVVSITEADLATPALTDPHLDGGFLHVANGRYRLDVPDAAFLTGVSQVTIGGTVTGMVVLPTTIQLVSFDPDDATTMGLSALADGNVYQNTNAVIQYITRGDSYDGTANNKLAWTVAKDYTGWTGTFTIRHRTTGASLCSATAVVTSSVLLNVTLAIADTAFSLLVTDDEFGPHPYDVEMVSGSNEQTAATGVAVIKKDRTVA